MEALDQGEFDVLGISSHGATHVTFADEISELLRDRKLDDSVAIALGGVVPLEDYGRLQDAGVDVIIPQGITIAMAADDIIDALGIPPVVDSRGAAASDQARLAK